MTRKFTLSLFTALSFAGCSIFHDRPIQLMSDTSAALKAAKEVSADSLAPEKYRKATEAYFKAQNEYRMKNFRIAEDYALRAKILAEESEYDALKQGSSRTSLLPPEMPEPPPGPSTYSPPEGELASEVMKRQATGGSSAPQGASQNGTGSGNGSEIGSGASSSSSGGAQQYPSNFSP